MENSKPLLIGLSARETTVYKTTAIYNNKAYFDFLKAADPEVMAVILPVVSEKEAAQYANLCDGLFLTGGADLHPSFYGEEVDGTADTYDLTFDQSDLYLYHAFRKADKPVLGVCRGIQVINVAEGGTLIQDIPSLTGAEHQQINFVPPKGKYDTAHTVKTVSGTMLQMILGDTVSVNSFHHQAIETPAPSLTISAFSEDGIIEGAEKNRVLAVQWHPERLLDQKEQVRIAGAFLSMCESARNTAE